MPGYFDIYVLAPDRSATTASRFLLEFAPRRQQSAAEYEFPQFSDRPTTVLLTAQEAIRYCIEHPSEPQSLYFRNLADRPAHVMLFFTADQGLIFGLSVEQAEAEDRFRRLCDWAGTQIGYVTFEEPPPATANEFRQMVVARS
jgi:hypothetical protein